MGINGFSDPEIVLLSNRIPPNHSPAGKLVTKYDSSGEGAPLFINYGIEEGLPMSSVICSALAKNGSLWFGTAGGGVSNYDGKSFTNYTVMNGLPNNTIFYIMEDAGGNIWFGTSAGVSRFNGKSFTNYSIAQGLPGNYVNCIFQDDKGNIWFGTHDGGISKFGGKNFTNYGVGNGLASNYIICGMQEKNHNLWFGTNGGLSLYNGKTFRNYTVADGLVNNKVNGIIQDNTGNIWCATSGGVSEFDGKKFRNFTIAQGLPDNNITCLLQDRTGAIWFGTRLKGISKYDEKGFTNYSMVQGLSDNNISSLLLDRTGNLWFTSLSGGGASRYQGKALTSYTPGGRFAGSFIMDITQDNSGNLWFGTFEEGAGRYDGKHFSHFINSPGLSDDIIWRSTRDKEGNLWFGTEKSGAIKYDGKEITRYTTAQGLPSNTVFCVMQDKKGNLWFSTGKGLSKFDGASFTNYTTRQGLPDNNIQVIVEDKDGAIWFGTHDSGACKFDGRNFTLYSTDQGLPNKTVYCMLVDKPGNVWFATNAGVAEFDGKRITSYAIAEGLPDLCAGALAEDTARNIIWIGTNRGLCALNEAITNSTDGRNPIEVFNHNTGYAIEGITRYSLFMDKSGLLWAGSGHNLISLNYPEISKKNGEALPLVLQNIQINNEHICWNCLAQKQNLSNKTDRLVLQNSMIENFGEILTPEDFDSIAVKYHDLRFNSVSPFHAIPTKLVLPFHDNSISIDFVAIDPVMPKQVKYQYKLEGYSKEWTQPGSNKTAVFQNLPEGDYIFKVKAKSAAGVWSETSYSFRVMPPWWRTWWAYAFYIFTVGGLLYAIYRYRINTIKHDQAEQLNIMVATQEQERRRISRDLHDDVGIKLSALKLYLSSLHEKSSETKNEAITALTQNSEKLIGDVMNDVRHLLHNLSPMILDEFGFIEAVQGIADKINETGQVYIQLIAFGIRQRLPKDYELALYRITQELINNALKHAHAKQVTLQIGQRDNTLIIMMEDDGIGFNTENQRDGYGLHNLAARTKLMKGVMKIDSQQGKGTSVYIEIPFNFN